ncbi:MAG: pantoate--beta-alanine ligase, partial [Desulfobaccales bacterium]
SRNVYLSPEERRAALCLNQALTTACRLAANGVTSREEILAMVRKIITQAPFSRIDYLGLVHPETLEEMDPVRGESRLLLAVWVGQTRLIDNISLRESPECCV